MSGKNWGDGTARDVAYDLVDEAIKHMLHMDLTHFHYLLPGRTDIGQVRDAVADIRAELSNRRESEAFPWDKVKIGAVFVHTRYLTLDRKPEMCKIYKLTFRPDNGIREVFYEVGGPGGDVVYNPAQEFPAAVKGWVNA